MTCDLQVTTLQTIGPYPPLRNPFALDLALDVLGDRWTLAVVAALIGGPLRFGELQDRIGSIAPNILTQRVRRLEADGLVLARPYSRRPLRVSYELTAAGESLRQVVDAMDQWAAQRAGRAPRSHDACGTPLELRHWCPTCERVVDPGHDELTHL